MSGFMKLHQAYQPSEVVRFRWCREIHRLGIFTPFFPLSAGAFPHLKTTTMDLLLSSSLRPLREKKEGGTSKEN